mgnify:CR=1 FL=1
MSAVENKRQFYRLKYPPGARPSVWFSKQRYCVSEVSEGGIRVILKEPSSLQIGFAMAGVLSLQNDSDVSIVGDVFRFDGHEMVIKLDKGPSFKHMVDEQRYIRSKYPAFYDRLRGKVA